MANYHRVIYCKDEKEVGCLLSISSFTKVVVIHTSEYGYNNFHPYDNIIELYPDVRFVLLKTDEEGCNQLIRIFFNGVLAKETKRVPSKEFQKIMAELLISETHSSSTKFSEKTKDTSAYITRKSFLEKDDLRMKEAVCEVEEEREEKIERREKSRFKRMLHTLFRKEKKPVYDIVTIKETKTVPVDFSTMFEDGMTQEDILRWIN